MCTTMDSQDEQGCCWARKQLLDTTADVNSIFSAHLGRGATCRGQVAARQHALLVLVLLMVACLLPTPARATSRMLQAETCTADKKNACARLGQVCAQNRCTAASCTKHQDCTSPAPYCILGKCKSTCTRDAQCKGMKGGAKYCVAGTCQAEMCSSDSHCSKRAAGATPFCVKQASGKSLCRECSNDAGCSGNPHGNACNAATGTCVQCTGQSHCTALAAAGGLQSTLGTAATSDKVTCDAATFTCKLDVSSADAVDLPASKTNCSTNEDCPMKGPWGPQQFCSTSGTTAGTCVECAVDSDCPAGLYGANGTCNADGRCVECSTNGATDECPKPGPLAAGGICNAGINKCVECATGSDCRFVVHPTATMLCWQGKCAVCGQDSHCTKYVGLEGLGPYCVDEQCQVKGKFCTSDTDCSYSATCFWLPDGKCPEGKCDTTSNTCNSFIEGL